MYGMTLVTQSETTREAIASILNNQIAKQSRDTSNWTNNSRLLLIT